MNEILRVAAPPSKPLVVYDGDCRFCILWIKRWQQATGDSVDYLPFQDERIPTRFPEIPRERFETAVQFIETDGEVFSGANAALRARAKNPRNRFLLRCYAKSAVFAGVSERCYRFVAEHRTIFSLLTRVAYGNHVEVSPQLLVRRWFLRGLGLVYLIAFLSLWTQIDGLIGSEGIFPAQEVMTALDQKTTAMNLGLDRYRMMPTLCWFNSSDGFLQFQCAAGVVLATLLIAGVAPMPNAFFLWLLYLSLVRIGRLFLGYQWDNLLLETGFLAIFLAPLQLWPTRAARAHEAPPSRIVLWLLRWLLFRLMFESGCVKLLSGDVSWHDLTALSFHYETQPLPTWIGWWAYQLPLWFQKTSCFFMFVIELAVPFLFFAPRRLRFIGAAATVFLQLLIMLTGNYTFFNWLTIVLCLLLLDDFVLARFRSLFRRRRGSAGMAQIEPVHKIAKPAPRWRLAITIPLAFLIITISAMELAALFGVSSPLLFPGVYVYYTISPFRSVNRYGLFAVMTKTRPEIIVEGSDDGVTWLPYEFKYKPGNLSRRPKFVAPHQPRLDWQMWFAALGNLQSNPWFQNFCFRLLQGSPDVLALLDENPFPNNPPKFVRASVYQYHFTDIAERRKTGRWWKREFKGQYMPPVSLGLPE